MRNALMFLLLAGVAQAEPDFYQALVDAAIDRTRYQIKYDGAYFKINYPNGDVPSHLGVCTDLIVRSYRKVGIDLQQRVHEDMSRQFAVYPSKKIWGLTAPDTNIDHRRVPNLQIFFSRHGQTLPVSDKADDYRPGDIVTWLLPGNLPHIGIVSDQKAPNGARFKVVHNIGAGPKLEDVLFAYRVTGHYRYGGAAQKTEN